MTFPAGVIEGRQKKQNSNILSKPFHFTLPSPASSNLDSNLIGFVCFSFFESFSLLPLFSETFEVFLKKIKLAAARSILH